MKCSIPPKPANQKEQISDLWEAVYNHIPSQLRLVNIQIRFILAFITIVMVLVAITLTVVIVG